MNTKTPTRLWYVARTGNHQGLVIDQATGRNVAVTYQAEDAPVVAAAPRLLAELEGLLEVYESALSAHIYDEENGEPIPASEHRYIAGLRALILEARGEQ